MIKAIKNIRKNFFLKLSWYLSGNNGTLHVSHETGEPTYWALDHDHYLLAVSFDQIPEPYIYMQWQELGFGRWISVKSYSINKKAWPSTIYKLNPLPQVA